MNREIRDGLFFLIVFTLIFNNIPKPIQFYFLGGPVGNKFCVYPLLVGFVYSFWCQYKYGNVFCDTKKFLKYIAVYIFVILLSTVVGLIVYPYYDVVLSGPVNQIEKLPRVLDFLHTHGIEADRKFLMQAWIVARQIKGVFLNAFWTFGGSYLIYCWYRVEKKRALEILLKGTLCSFAILFVYGCVETAYLAGNNRAAEILKAVNPYLHPIAIGHGWWPPLLWPGQMRLVFSEPSNIGNYVGCILPVLWGLLFLNPKKRWMYTGLFATVLITFFVGLSKARTAYAMLVGMLALLLFLIIIGKQWKLFKKYALILCCVGIGFGAFVGVTEAQFAEEPEVKVDYSLAMKKDKEESVEVIKKGEVKSSPMPKQDKAEFWEVAKKALEDNLGSLASGNKRSNGARYAILKSHMRTSMQHPILGVGNGLTSVFTEKNFTKEEAKNGEVAMWIRYQRERGPFATGYGIPGAMNEYVNRFSNNGILGLGVFLFPFLYVIFHLFKKMRAGSLGALVMLMALVSSMVAGCNGSLMVVYGTWILLGLSYVICFGCAEEKEPK